MASPAPTPQLTPVHFFGGHDDGAERSFHLPPHTYDYPIKAGDATDVGKDYTRYVHSEEWTEFLSKWTMIPEGFLPQAPSF